MSNPTTPAGWNPDERYVEVEVAGQKQWHRADLLPEDHPGDRIALRDLPEAAGYGIDSFEPDTDELQPAAGHGPSLGL